MKVRASIFRSNDGQAALEALLLISFGVLLLLGIHQLGQARAYTLQLIAESHFLSFSPLDIVKKINNSFEFSRLSRRRENAYSAQHLELENQLGFDSTAIVRATARYLLLPQSDAPVPTLNQQIPLVRHSYLLPQYGQADSMQQVQSLLSESRSLWHDSFSISKSLVERDSGSFERIDQSWGRTALGSDWLLPWANETSISADSDSLTSNQLERSPVGFVNNRSR